MIKIYVYVFFICCLDGCSLEYYNSKIKKHVFNSELQKESTNTSEENDRLLPEKNDIEQGKALSGIIMILIIVP